MGNNDIKIIGVITQIGNESFGIWENFALTREENHDIVCLMEKYNISGGSSIFESLQELYQQKSQNSEDMEIDFAKTHMDKKMVSRWNFENECAAISYCIENIRTGCYICFSCSVRIHCYIEKMSYGSEICFADVEVYNGTRYLTVASWSSAAKDNVNAIVRHACWRCEQYM